MQQVFEKAHGDAVERTQCKRCDDRRDLGKVQLYKRRYYRQRKLKQHEYIAERAHNCRDGQSPDFFTCSCFHKNASPKLSPRAKRKPCLHKVNRAKMRHNINVVYLLSSGLYRRLRNHTGSCLSARGLYRR